MTLKDLIHEYDQIASDIEMRAAYSGPQYGPIHPADAPKRTRARALCALLRELEARREFKMDWEVHTGMCCSSLDDGRCGSVGCRIVKTMRMADEWLQRDTPTKK